MATGVIFGVGVVVTLLVAIYFVMIAIAARNEADGPKNWE